MIATIYGRIVLVTLCFLGLATLASAEEGSLESVGDWIPLWRSPSVIKEGNDLYNASQYDLAAQRIVCLVDYGTRVIGNFAGGSLYGDRLGVGATGGVARIVVIEGEAAGCTGYVESMRFRLTLERNRKPASPCWTTKQEMASVKAMVDAGNLPEAHVLSQKVTDRMKECRSSPCFMTKEEGDAIKAAYATGNSKLGRELMDKSTDRSTKCWESQPPKR